MKKTLKKLDNAGCNASIVLMVLIGVILAIVCVPLCAMVAKTIEPDPPTEVSKTSQRFLLG